MMCPCPLIDHCPFSKNNLDNIPPNSDEHKTYYCINNSFKCARLLTARILGINSVPLSLQPNEMKKAEELINTQR